MALKKSQLYASLWQSCDELRGGMDASQYKDYILTLLFVKYISDKAESPAGSLIEVPDGGGFTDMVKHKGDIEIGDKVNKIIGKLAEANALKGVIDLADFNDESKLGRGREMVDRISKLIAIFEGLDLRMNRAEGDDLLGDAYEYLMRHFATESGKSKGQFYTPAEVSRVMAKVIGIGQNTQRTDTIYDPTCGSGSLLLRAADESPDGMSVFGQEKDTATHALARMNMILHDDETAELWHGNTLADPYFKDTQNNLKTFDFAVANPPFSDKAWTTGLNPAHDEYGRFVYGVPPAKNGDYAFLLHFIASLKSIAGKGAIILPHGVLFRGNREADIRREIIRCRYIKGIIGLPANLFYGTGIPACILVIDKESAYVRNGIFMIDASKGFLKDGNKNRLRAQDIHKIVFVFNEQTELPRYSRMVPISEIADAANDYNLNIPRYIDASEPEDLHDLGAHLNGGIPDTDIDALNTYWTVFPTLRNSLFKANGRPDYSDPIVETQQVKTTILTHPEFKTYQQQVSVVFEGWREAHQPLLFDIDVGTSPRKIVETLSEDLLNRFTHLPLLDQYDAYQKLMDYWDEVMQDDVYLIAADDWIEATKPREVIQDKQMKETPDLVIKKNKYKMDLIPPALIVARYFADEQAAIEMLQTKLAAAESELAEFVEEHTGEDGLLADATNDSGNITANSVKARLKALTPDLITHHETQDSDDEQDALEHCLSLLDAKSKADKAIKDAQIALDTQVLAHYTTLTEDEIKTLVVADKWFGSIQSAIDGEVQRLTQALTGRVQELEERYAQPLPDLEQEMETFRVKVEGHLKSMGADWE